MRVILKPGLIAISAETDAERAELAAWGADRANHVFHLPLESDRGLALYDLGRREDACAEPINITYDGVERWRPISNLAHTPFDLDGRRYASVEGFWQGLKFAAPEDRARVAALWGTEAKAIGIAAPAIDRFEYEGKSIDIGRPDHWQLMTRACRAKFLQNDEARSALLATGERPLLHKVRRDSQTIPGVVVADIWMRARRILLNAQDDAAEE
jgi:hypothetical protein